MKKIIILLCFILLLKIIFIVSQVIGETAKSSFESGSGSGLETYIQKQIIFAPWGSGIGDMGLKNIYSLGNFRFASGPSSIRIDREGNIYIWDGINERIQKYNKNGQYLMKISYSDLALNINLLSVDDFRIDDDGDIYFLMHALENGSVIGNYFVRRYTADNKTVDFQIYIKKQEILDLPEIRIYVKNGDLFIASPISFNGWQILNRGREISASSQKIQKVITFKEGLYKFPQGNGFEETGSIFEYDTNYNIYKLSDLSKINNLDPKDWNQRIYKYDRNGDLCAEVKLELDHLWYRHSNITIDGYGNVYQLLSKPEGTYVMKWEVTRK